MHCAFRPSGFFNFQQVTIFSLVPLPIGRPLPSRQSDLPES